MVAMEKRKPRAGKGDRCAPVMARQIAALGGWPGEVLLNRGERSKERRQLAEQICGGSTVDTGTPRDQR